MRSRSDWVQYSIDVSYLCRPLFSVHFIHGLSQYKLQNTWNIHSKTRTDSHGQYQRGIQSSLPIIALILACVFTLFIAYLTQQIRGIDSLKTDKLLLFIAYLTNAHSNVFYAVYACMEYFGTNNASPKWTLLRLWFFHSLKTWVTFAHS